MQPPPTKQRFHFTLWRLFLMVSLVAIVAGFFANYQQIQFWLFTGHFLPQNAHIIARGDSHGGFHGDGEYYYVFGTDAQTIQDWLKAAPPWGETWLRGPVTTRAKFGGVAGSDEVNESKEVWFAARDRSPQQGEYHRPPWVNCDIIILDPRTNRVWISSFDI
jgi:hypothetical protein